MSINSVSDEFGRLSVRNNFSLYETEWFSSETFWHEVEGKLYQRGVYSMNEFLVTALGVSRTTIWRWKKGRGETPVSVIYALSELLVIDLEKHRQLNMDALKAKEVFNLVFPTNF